ncbi:nucleotidyl transferase AbiEii/AbiGii toxin family protein [Trichothermofontia sp.]
MTLLNPGILTLQEFMSQEPLPLATLQQAILAFLQGKDDVVIFGAQAVNAYVSEARMTQDIDLMSTRASDLAEALRAHLSQTFHIAIRIRQVAEGRGYRLFQVRKAGNRHLVDIRTVETLPPAQRIANLLVLAPDALIVSKVIAYHQRRNQPKAGTDWRDLVMLLLKFPNFKQNPDLITEQLLASNAPPEALTLWQTLVAQEIELADEDTDF